ncbi:MAG: cation-translocating P-type ATPase [Salinibacterium sp.]|nr:cation-translocating P-type ATPase [Salinibacterium sp.]
MRGLGQTEVAERLARGESNTTQPVTSRPLFHIIRDNVFTLFNAILTACFALIVLIGDLRDGLFFGVVIANSLIGIVQEVRAKLALDRLALLASPTVAVRRDGKTVILHPNQLVIDDIVVLRPGDQVVADARVLECTDLTMNEALLTGESEPVAKRADDGILSGSLVASGAGLAVVTAVGSASYANRLTAEIRAHSLAVSELRAATNRILVYISWIIGPVVLVVITSRLLSYGNGLDVTALSGARWRDAALDLVASVVGFIPEGLVLLISLAYGVAAIRLAREHVLIQELAAVEILARVDVLCLDKTGTLTSGEIKFTRAEVLAVDHRMPIALAHFANDDAANATAHALVEEFSDTSGTVLTRIPFASKRACSALGLEHDGTQSSWLLGAPERLFAAHPELLARAASFAEAGRRTLALVLVHGELPVADELMPESLEATPIAILVFAEEIRSDAASTLAFFAEQGVRCIIMSGDNPSTVAALAVGLGVGTSSVDARQLNGDDEIRAALSGSSIFGRVTPEQKRAMVRVLKADGHTVAMTGDGVNDAMAIKDADLGIAMGSGTSASRAVARLVLLDDKFERLPTVLAYGRQVIANVERAANLFLSKTVYGIVFAIVFALLLWEFPFLPRQLTLVSTLTIGIPAFFLALAPNMRLYHPGILNRLLRYAAPTGMIAAGTTFLAYAVLRAIVPQAQAQSIATVTLFIVTFWILCVLSRPVDAWRGLMLAGMLGLFALVFIVPFGQEFFAVSVEVGLPLLFGMVVGMAGAVVIEAAYRVARRRGLIFDRA